MGTVLLVATVCWLAVVGAGSRLPARATVAAIVAAHLVIFLAPPLLSADVFGYIGFARLGAVHGINPYVHGLALVPGDPVRPFARWHTATSPYVPLFTVASYATAPLGVAGALWAFKAVALLGGLGLAAVTWRLAARRGLPPAATAAFVSLNPLTLLFAVGGAHNDVGITALGVAGLGLAVTRAPATGGATVMASAMSKASSGLLLPFVVLAAPSRGRALLGAAAVAALTAVLGLTLFGTHAFAFTDALTTQQRLVATRSIPNQLGLILGTGGITTGIRVGAYAVLGVGLVASLRMAWRGADPFTAAGWAALAVLVSTAWLVPWYAVWLLPLAALSRDRTLRGATIALTAAIVAMHVPAIAG